MGFPRCWRGGHRQLIDRKSRFELIPLPALAWPRWKTAVGPPADAIPCLYRHASFLPSLVLAPAPGAQSASLWPGRQLRRAEGTVSLRGESRRESAEMRPKTGDFC